MNPSHRAASLPAFSTLLDTTELASLGPTPRPSRKALTVLKADLEKVLAENKQSAESAQLIRALVLLWHDYLDEAHSIAQDIPSTDGSFVHAIMHRREPDYWNSKYWFNRVGRHAAFAKIAEEVRTSLKTDSDGIINKLINNGGWNPNAFVDLCEQFAGKTISAEYRLLQQVQLIETRVLLNHFVAGPQP